MMKFKCNGCKRPTEFIKLESFDLPDSIGVYQCKDCCAIGVKNEAESIQNDKKVCRCDQCGAWQFEGKDCNTCVLLL